MSRKTAHLLTPELYGHVYNRGVNKEPIYPSQWYYEYFLQRLETCVKKVPVNLLAFNLMPNHFHLIVQQPIAYLLSAFMKLLCDGFAKAFNKTLDRSGHVFQDSYKLRPIETVDDLVNLSRYVHLNPVRANLVTAATDWEYSSARMYCGMDKRSFLDPSIILSQFGRTPEASYQRFLLEYCDQSQDWLARCTFQQRKKEGRQSARGVIQQP
jgi:putative transposase